MGEPIETGRGQEWVVPEGLGPLGVVAVTGDQDRSPLVALADDLVEVLGFLGSKRPEAEVIEDQEVRSKIDREPSLVGSIGPTAVEMREHLLDGGKEHVVAPTTGLLTEGLGEMALAHAAGSDDEDILFAFDPRSRRQIEDLLPVDRGVERPVEPFERLVARKRRPPKSEHELLLTSALDFVLEQPFQELHVRELVLDGLTVTHVESLQNPREP